MLSDAVAEIVVAPDTVVLGKGAVMETVGGIVSGAGIGAVTVSVKVVVLITGFVADLVVRVWRDSVPVTARGLSHGSALQPSAPVS